MAQTAVTGCAALSPRIRRCPRMMSRTAWASTMIPAGHSSSPSQSHGWLSSETPSAPDSKMASADRQATIRTTKQRPRTPTFSRSLLLAAQFAVGSGVGTICVSTAIGRAPSRRNALTASNVAGMASHFDTYFPQVEEAIWSEFPGPFHDMKACSGTASNRSTSRCKCVNSTSNVCTVLPLWTSSLRAARLNSRKSCSVVGCAQSRCSG
jgi:hypothetical protein